MGKLVEYSCVYGSGRTKAEVLVYEMKNGKSWYVVKGGSVVNLTWDSLYDGIDVEDIKDIDCFTCNECIDSLGQLEDAINS